MNVENIKTVWDDVRTSFWFVPSLMIGMGGLLALAGAALERRMKGTGADAPWFIPVSASSDARDLMSTLVTSMVTATSLIFSISMVVLTLAASQFGPRLVRNFMASRQTQLILGTFVMTIVYGLLTLSMMGSRSSPEAEAQPALAIAVALVGLLGLFQHELARSIMAETIITRVGEELNGLVLALPRLEAPPDEHPERALPERFEEEAAHLGPARAGYIQAIDFRSLSAAAERADCLVGLHSRAGDYVVRDGNGIAIHPAGRASDALCREVRQAIVVGIRRTPVQDVEFSIRHLVEIALRAMSPSLNDPFTAITVIDQLSDSLSLMLNHELPPGLHRDSRGILRVVCPRPTHASVLGAALDQIRQNGADKPVVAIHLLEALERLALHAALPAQVEAMRAHVDLVLEAARSQIAQEADLGAVERRGAAATAALSKRSRAPFPLCDWQE
ncbi:DUF2254 domain-containing protein [Cereibacter johrii]|uniref:Membrane protein n=1 Tax=Cereibacter johrii TaxID=445629 RepID=A0ABX5J2S1_9RHOB|nr:DUF2254 domain-containing protein [Cereibacter johrii]PTM75878.1 putative membrane protein [Cereibacter johrii]